MISREWLVANGIGGYAMGTVDGRATRAYHGYLLATTTPPVGRTLLWHGVEEFVGAAGQPWRPLKEREIIEPAGDEHRLEHFVLDGTLPVWTFRYGDALLEKRLWMAYGANTTYLQYRLLAGAELGLRVALLVNDRDHHGASMDDGTHWSMTPFDDPIELQREDKPDATPWRLVVDPPLELAPGAGWRKPHWLAVEAERGLTAWEQVYELGSVSLLLREGDTLTLIASTEPPDAVERDAGAALRAEQSRQKALLATAGASEASLPVRQLVLAADQFIVVRRVAEAGTTREGRSVTAGYPWFGDWGRDTMISLPGLCLSTGRHAEAALILRTFARFVSEGMLPNRFPDEGEAPEYNTVDATLWYFDAIRRYLDATDDQTLLADLFPVLAEIIRWHRQGTRYGIGMDPADGLLRAGTAGAQLTWMDVRIDGDLLRELAPELAAERAAHGAQHELVVTPRHGKAVEINALWYRALRLMSRWAAQRGESNPYAALAEQVQTNFGRFWNAAGGYLFDVIDTPDGDDPALRPNQVLAIAVAPELLPAELRRSALEQVAARLWTPQGLRTLDPRDPAYQARFTGNRVQRDMAYHQGTVWPWLIGRYVDAWRELEPTLDVRPLLQPLLDHLWEHGLGSVAEVFDADAPRFGAGCPAQAWSVAELLRVIRTHLETT